MESMWQWMLGELEEIPTAIPYNQMVPFADLTCLDLQEKMEGLIVPKNPGATANALKESFINFIHRTMGSAWTLIPRQELANFGYRSNGDTQAILAYDFHRKCQKDYILLYRYVSSIDRLRKICHESTSSPGMYSLKYNSDELKRMNDQKLVLKLRRGIILYFVQVSSSDISILAFETITPPELLLV